MHGSMHILDLLTIAIKIAKYICAIFFGILGILVLHFGPQAIHFGGLLLKQLNKE